MTSGGARAATGRLLVLLVLFVSTAIAAPDSTREKAHDPAPGTVAEVIPDSAARWLAEVAPLISPAERAAYLALARPYQRAAFEQRGRDREVRIDLLEHYVAELEALDPKD